MSGKKTSWQKAYTTKEGFIHMATPTDTQTRSDYHYTHAKGKSTSAQEWILLLLVFIAGAASLSVEMDASRLFAPYFGTSLFVWANLIGLILLYLTVGYYVGGLLSDRYPRPAFIYIISIAAALFIELIPLIAQPILSWSLNIFAADPLGIFYGSLVAVIILFAIPTILLGCVSPYAIRLRVSQVGSTGRVAGLLYAISTAGSILGTFLPVLWIIPTLGVTQTFFVTGAALLFIAIIGLIISTVKNATKERDIEQVKSASID